jgi:hypothetical protein
LAANALQLHHHAVSAKKIRGKFIASLASTAEKLKRDCVCLKEGFGNFQILLNAVWHMPKPIPQDLFKLKAWAAVNEGVPTGEGNCAWPLGLWRGQGAKEQCGLLRQANRVG